MPPEGYVQTLYNLAYRLTGNTRLAQELCLDAATELGRQGLSLDDPGLRAKTARVVADLVLNNHRYDSFPVHPAAGDPSHRLQNALNSLPLKERLAVVLRDLYGLAYPELASIFRGDKRMVARLLSCGRCGVCRWLKEREQAPDELG